MPRRPPPQPRNRRCVWIALLTLPISAPMHASSGFFVSGDGHFIAALHSIGNCPRPAIITAGGPRDATRVAQWNDGDVVLLKTADPPAAFAGIAGDILPGASVRILSFRKDGPNQARSAISGKFAGRLKQPTLRLLIEAEQPIISGDSGSPVIDETRNLVVGLLQAHDTLNTERGIALSGLGLLLFLESAQVPVATTPPTAERLTESAFSFPVTCREDE